jgi:hypothetical protein
MIMVGSLKCKSRLVSRALYVIFALTPLQVNAQLTASMGNGGPVGDRPAYIKSRVVPGQRPLATSTPLNYRVAAPQPPIGLLALQDIATFYQDIDSSMEAVQDRIDEYLGAQRSVWSQLINSGFSDEAYAAVAGGVAASPAGQVLVESALRTASGAIASRLEDLAIERRFGTDRPSDLSLEDKIKFYEWKFDVDSNPIQIFMRGVRGYNEKLIENLDKMLSEFGSD